MLACSAPSAQRLKNTPAHPTSANVPPENPRRGASGRAPPPLSPARPAPGPLSGCPHPPPSPGHRLASPARRGPVSSGHQWREARTLRGHGLAGWWRRHLERDSKEKADCFFFWGRPGWLWLRMPAVVPPNTRPSPKSNRPGLELSVSQPLCHRTGAVQNKLSPSVRSIPTALSASALALPSSSRQLRSSCSRLARIVGLVFYLHLVAAASAGSFRVTILAGALCAIRFPSLRFRSSLSLFLLLHPSIPVVRAPQSVPVPVLTNPTALSCPRFVTTPSAHARHTSPRRLRTPRPTTSCHHR